MEIEGVVSEPRLPLAEDSAHTVRLGPQGGLIVQQVHGDQFLGVYNDRSFHGGNQGPAGVVTTVGLATTYTGLVLSNPVNSGVLLAINDVEAAFNVVFPAAAFIGIFVGYSATTNVTHTTPLTIQSSRIGAGASAKARLDSAATLPAAPTVATVFGSVLASAAGHFENRFNGSLVLPGGAYMGIYTSTVSGAAALMATIGWEEIRVS